MAGNILRFTTILVLSLYLLSPVSAYFPYSLQDDYFSDSLLREIMDKMGRWEAEKELSSASEDIYLDPVMNTRASKTLENEQMDYDSLLDMNQNPSVRDQEYLQHSSLWGHQYVSGGAGEGPHRVEPQVKSDATLPAYCTPPNPCPVGYSEEQGCTTTFENTAAFSREYQAMQECMCDGEHMFECPQEPRESARQMEPDLESYLAHQYQTSEHKNLVAKKFYHKKLEKPDTNPYLQGEKLPVAAKKGNFI